MALHISTQRDIARTEAVMSLVAAGILPAMAAKPNHVALTPLTPFMRELPAQKARPSAAHASAVHGPLVRYQRPACLQPTLPTTEPESESVPAAEHLAPMVLSLELALAWRDDATRQTREAANRLVALYQNRYDWRKNKIAPRREAIAA